MAEVSLLVDGDETERNAWESLRPYFHRYEGFWHTHIFPLRCPGVITLRDGIDEEFETLAMCNYTTFVNVARAFQKIQSKSEGLKFSEEIYSNLQRAAEVAIKTVDSFRKIYQACLNRKSDVSTSPLSKIELSFKTYRNILHDPILATVKKDGVRLIPRRDKTEKYRRWTTAMYHQEPVDFVAVETQLRSDFEALCSALQSTWKAMEEASIVLIKNREYIRRRSKGVSPSKPSTVVPSASGTSVG